MNNLERSYSTLFCSISDNFVLCYPTLLRSQAFVTMQSIMLAMGSVREKVKVVLILSFSPPAALRLFLLSGTAITITICHH